jgi:glutaminase A
MAQILFEAGVDPAQQVVQQAMREAAKSDGNLHLDLADDTSILTKAAENRLAVPQWREFCATLRQLHDNIKDEPLTGRNADYISVLAEADPNKFAVAVCTVDGQQFAHGDWDELFSIQSCVKPLSYAVAVEDIGVDAVHRHVGIEASGLAFNEVSLNADDRPHNPMINAGAIATCGCIRRSASMSERFSYFAGRVRDLAGGEQVGFSQATYLCEHETAWRNNALLYYMVEAGVFAPESIPEEVLDFYIQCCAMEVNTKSAAVIAATLANGGVCPSTGKRCLSPATVKSCLTLMFSCGMYDYSGTWAIEVGLPAKSGVAGLVYVVVPNKMGIAIWSPPLDSHGNSARAVEFCSRLLQRYSLGTFASIANATAESMGIPAHQAMGAGGRQRTLSKASTLGEDDADTLVEVRGGKHGDGSPSSLGLSRSGAKYMLNGKVLHSTQHAVQARMAIRGRCLRALHAFGKVARALASVHPDGPSHPSNDVAQGALDKVDALVPWQALKGADGRPLRPIGTKQASYAHLLRSGIAVSHVRAWMARRGIVTEDSGPMNPSLGGSTREAPPGTATLGPAALLSAMERSGSAGVITLDNLLVHNETSLNVVIRALLDDLVMPNWGDFTAAIDTMSDFAAASKRTLADDASGIEDEEEPSGTEKLFSRICEMVSALPDDFGVAICSTDGQIHERGDTRKRLPALDGVKPLLYALAVDRLGMERLGDWVGSEPTSLDPESFELLHPSTGGHGTGEGGTTSINVSPEGEVDHTAPALDLRTATLASTQSNAQVDHASRPQSAPVPHNPFTTAGALSLACLLSKELGQEGDTGARFDQLLGTLQRLAAGSKIGFNNPVFLSLKQDALNPMAIAHYMKGLRCFPSDSDPTDVAHFYFQCMSLELSPHELSIMAASLAAMGRCPLTGEQVLHPSILKPLLSSTYTCGLNQYSGPWQFHVGIPAVASGVGTLMLVVPNVMGMVIYAPEHKWGVGAPRRAEHICRQLVSRYRLHLFDHLEMGADSIAVSSSEQRSERVEVNVSHLFNDLCKAAGAGDVRKVKELVQAGAPLLYVDYDYRSALHVAACEGHLNVVRLLVEAGHPLNVRDRWNHTPLHEALTCVADSAHEVYVYLRGALWRSGKEVPPTEVLLVEASQHVAAHGSRDAERSTEHSGSVQPAPAKPPLHGKAVQRMKLPLGQLQLKGSTKEGDEEKEEEDEQEDARPLRHSNSGLVLNGGRRGPGGTGTVHIT